LDLRSLVLSWLARRELSERQVRQRLARRGVDEAEVDAVVARLREDGSLDDRRVAGAHVRTAIRLKQRGPARLAADLASLGIDPATSRDAITEALAESDESTLLARALARRWKSSEAPSLADAARLYRALVRQGFSPDRVRSAIDALGTSPDSD
jgi:regulatory protein